MAALILSTHVRWLNNELATRALPIVDRWYSAVRDCRCVRQLQPDQVPC